MRFHLSHCLYQMYAKYEIVIIGKILENEKRIKFKADIHCNDCGVLVPGGLQTGESYFQTDDFKIELEEFKQNYLCGICRDKKRVKK